MHGDNNSVLMDVMWRINVDGVFLNKICGYV